MYFIGITGGIGAGKSEILKYIREKYPCEVYLADEVAHKVKSPGTKCFSQLIALLGEDLIGADGQIDKAKMAEKIFAHAEILQKVNQIVHPAVKEYLLEKLEKAKQNPQLKFFFVEAALLIETGYTQLVDEMWYIYADKEVRSKRLKESRGYQDEKIAYIMANQLSEEEFRRNCNFIIDNSGKLTDSYQQIDTRLEALK